MDKLGKKHSFSGNKSEKDYNHVQREFFHEGQIAMEGSVKTEGKNAEKNKRKKFLAIYNVFF